MIYRNVGQHDLVAIFPNTNLPPVSIPKGEKVVLNVDFELYRKEPRQDVTETLEQRASMKNWRRNQ